MKQEKGRIAAFFDFDKTLLTTDSAALGLRFLWELGLLPGPYIAKVLFANIFYQRHLISDEAMADILLTFYKDKRLDPFVDSRCEFYQYKVKPRLSKNLLERLRMHQQAGHVTVLLSGALRYSLEPVMADLKMNHLLCSELEVGEDGLLTGRTKGPLCVKKAKAAMALNLACEQGIDLARSHAYGDHQSDLDILSMVGYPYAVQPTKPLLKIARQRGWPVLKHS